MENLLYSLQATTYGIRLTIISLLHNQMIWGFCFGFIASTIVHLFIATDLAYSFTERLKTTIKKSLSKKTSSAKEKPSLLSFVSFQKEYTRLRVLFYSMFILFLSVLLILLIRF